MTLNDTINCLEEIINKKEKLNYEYEKEYKELIKLLDEFKKYKNYKSNEITKVNNLILENSVSEGYLQDWYISSVNENDDPKWTEKHIAELTNDFYLIPKEVIFELSSIEDLKFSNRTLWLLKRNGINTIKELLEYSEYDILNFHGCGDFIIKEIKNVLDCHNLNLKK